MKEKYKVIIDNNGYLIGFEIAGGEDKTDLYEFDASKINLEYINCYKLVDSKPKLDNEKYQKTLAKKEFVKTDTLETEMINDYRIVKDSDYHFLVTSNILL